MLNQDLNHEEVKKIKFTDTYTIDNIGFERNSVWEYYDKYETINYGDGDEFILMYRIKIGDDFYKIPEDVVVEFDETYNKDYTKEQWRKKITTDAMVKDGNYVKAWRETYGINEPVKPIADQNDYNWKWTELRRRMEEFYKIKAYSDGADSIS